MQNDYTALAEMLDLERIERNIFRGQSHDVGVPHVFGGQVLAQALAAASATVRDGVAHSLHAYFLRMGDVDAPIVYQVDYARNGMSFSNRRVVAIQHGKQIFNMTASFQTPEHGLEHQVKMPDVPGPEHMPDVTETELKQLKNLPEKIQRFLEIPRPFDVRQVTPIEEKDGEAVNHVWMKAKDPAPDDAALHQIMLAYISDYQLLGTVTLPHGDISLMQENLQMASLDHAMWFHRPCRVDEWLLFSFDSPNASGARGLARGLIFTEKGDLVASTVQEGLIRLRS